MNESTIPCETCGRPTTMLGTRLCVNCWEVECRLKSYLKSEGGRARVRLALTGEYVVAKEIPTLQTPPCCTLRKQTVYLLRYTEQVRSGLCQKLVGIYLTDAGARQEIERICSSYDDKLTFWDSFVCPLPTAINTICADYFSVEAFELQGSLPILDDWAAGQPDAWDYEAVLREYEVTVEWNHQVTSDGETFTEAPPDLCGWGFYWKYGAIHIGQTTRLIARKAAALFVSLWLRGVSASFCDKLMDGYICFLERQEETSLVFQAAIHGGSDGRPFFRLTREDFCTNESFVYDAEEKIIKALTPTPDEEITVTFTKRKKQ